jgi:hypothetical protein
VAEGLSRPEGCGPGEWLGVPPVFGSLPSVGDTH